jgi:hypothetical protein
VVIGYFCYSVYLGLILNGLRFHILLSVAVGFIITFFTIESIGNLKTVIYFLIAFLTIGVISSYKLLFSDIINIYFSRLSTIIFSDIVILFLSLVSLRVMFNWVFSFLYFPFLFSFPLLIINFNYFLSKICEANSLLVSFIDFVLNFRL